VSLAVKIAPAVATPPRQVPGHIPGQAQVQAQVRVMVCDDSVAIRGAIVRMLESDPAIRVVARVANGKLAVDELARTQVDVVVLDIEMPVLDGLAALPLLLRADPDLRIIMASTLTTRGADVAMRALRLGAADYVPKPSSIGVAGDDTFRRDLIEKVKGLARLRRRTASLTVGAPTVASPIGATPLATRAAPPPLRLRPAATLPARLLAIGSSTGGPQALFTLVQALGDTLSVPVVLTQHMPRTFTPILAEHITKLHGMPCAEAKHNEMLEPGRIYLAPGDRHLLIERTAGGLQARLTEDPPENFCRPSVDPMLRSATAACDGRVLVAMLTGMGHDGLAGTRCVIEAGGTAIAQDEATSVVWGMPGAVAQAGLCAAVLPLPEIAGKLRTLLGRPRA
jgi:two-component system, chemotaxis family, protein-glutamate methylesterase/glutaminase